MNIHAEIEGIEYKLIMSNELKEINIVDFDINTMPSCCIIKSRKYNFAISKWVSPKRTRSYPFERVYNTLSVSKKITVIPIIKDEGSKGDRDFIQWDTISLMSLLDVYVIFAYYHKAEKHSTRENKITNQKFDNEYVLSKIEEIGNYHSSALHWNLKEIKDCLPFLIDKVKQYYSNINKQLGVSFHSSSGIDKFRKQFEDGFNKFMETSRNKAKEAQHREQMTIQPREVLTTATKATITIKNYLGGLYYLTTDEIAIKDEILYLIEGKHSTNSQLPSLGDIKDGLLKMILYCNLTNVLIENINYTVVPILKLTSNHITGKLTSSDSDDNYKLFFKNNTFNNSQIEILNTLFKESQLNNFEIIIQGE
ncbi:MAG: hypothetical protein BGO29_10265 [Bacteroidales bacterium 36-12]|nr:MAG: hypothetical protein BGO29_10265 [Bacteroidales bacterium 36-12]